MKEKLLISACLLGTNCKYSGGNNYTPLAEALKERFRLVPVCPETMGGLTSPREPAERAGDKVLSRSGEDWTEAFRLGAERALETALAQGITLAVLKERSPSCGCGAVYDGTFTGAVVRGDGVTAELLKAHGLRILGESRIGELLQDI